jgi:hypothetical protein
MLPTSQIDHIFTHFETPHLSHLLPSKDPAGDIPRDNSLQPGDAERQPLLPHSQSSRDVDTTQVVGRKEHAKSFLYRMWSGLKSALNPPLIGGLAAVTVGIIPFLHKLFLSETSPIAAFTVSIEQLGELYTSLQIFVLGGQLYSKR